MLVSAVIDNMGLSNREELMEQLAKSQQPDPNKQQMEQSHMQMQMEQAQAQLQLTQAQAQEASARAQKAFIEAQLEPQVVQAKLAAALSTNLDSGGTEDKSFAQRAKMTELLLKEKDIDSNERIAMMQMQKIQQTAWQIYKSVV